MTIPPFIDKMNKKNNKSENSGVKSSFIKGISINGLLKGKNRNNKGIVLLLKENNTTFKYKLVKKIKNFKVITPQNETFINGFVLRFS